MKRITSVLIAVLLGAIATGIGVVPFLVLANQDRNQLSEDLRQTEARALQIEDEKQQIADEANKRVEEANEEIERAQTILEEVQEDQQLLATAPRLDSPSSWETYRWKTAISLFQEVSATIPPGSAVLEDTREAFTVTELVGNDAPDPRASWLTIMPFDELHEAELLTSLASSTETAVVVQDRLLKGKRGTLRDGTESAVYRVRQSATTTHLIWIKDPGTLGRSDGIEKLLGTLEFNS